MRPALSDFPLPARARPRGFTLLELMVVLLILALLAGIAGPQLMKQFGKAKTQTAKIEVDALASAVNYFGSVEF